MKLTTRGRYAVTAMVDLASHTSMRPVSLEAIAKRQEISRAYLEQLFFKLRRHGLIKSVRGPGGGYLMMHSPDEISVADIIRAVDESVQATSCDGSAFEGCQKSSRCITHDLWVRLGDHILSFLESVSLDKLIETGGMKQSQR